MQIDRKQLRGRAPFLGSEAVQDGWLTKAQLRSTALRQLFYDVYVGAAVPDTHLLWIKAALLRMPPDAVIAGRSAAHVWGVSQVPEAVEIIVASHLRANRSRDGLGPSLDVHRDCLSDEDRSLHRNIRVTTPLRTAWDIGRWLPIRDAVPWIDALGRVRRLDPIAIGEECRRLQGPGSVRAGEAIAMCDPRAESFPESTLRVELLLEGLPRLIPQWHVYDGSTFVARVDLAWPDVRLAVEYDGIWHASREQLVRDRDRLRRLNAAGWRVFPVTAQDMYDIPALAAELRRVRRTILAH